MSFSRYLSKLGALLNSSGQVPTTGIADLAITAAKLAPGVGAAPVDIQTFNAGDSDLTWEKPTGGQTMCKIQVWGGGGGGNRQGDTIQAAGGGGGYNEATIPLSYMGSTTTITVGAAGVGRVSTTGPGTNGGMSAVSITNYPTGSKTLTAYGGGGGQTGVSRGTTMGGGGSLGAGGLSTGGAGYSTADSGSNGNGTAWGGAVGGANGGCGITSPGTALFGGGGGAVSTGAGGASLYGGNGGNRTTNGQTPGGGGGAAGVANVNGTNGGAGLVIITSW